MDSPTTPRPILEQGQSNSKKIWHPKTRSAGLGWMSRPEVRHLYMYFDIREFVLQDMSATAQEVDFLVLRRLIPRPLVYPSMEQLKRPPPDGFRRISMRYIMTDIPQPLENNREDIIPALRRIRIHLKRLYNFEGPFRAYELTHPDLFRQTVLLKFDFHKTEGEPQAETNQEPEPDLADTPNSSLCDLSEPQPFGLSDCSSFEGSDKNISFKNR